MKLPERGVFGVINMPGRAGRETEGPIEGPNVGDPVVVFGLSQLLPRTTLVFNSPLPWSEYSLFPHFLPALLNPLSFSHAYPKSVLQSPIHQLEAIRLSLTKFLT
jgi:hypothetical protein